MNPTETTFFSNKAACFFEQKNFDKCIEVCEEGLAGCKGDNYDFTKLGKILARKANALIQLERFDEGIDCYQSALLEHNDPKIKYALQQAKKTKNSA
jgi:tetratricopeptide (TPR) repeat protein